MLNELFLAHEVLFAGDVIHGTLKAKKKCSRKK